MHLHIIAARANSPGVVEVGITEGRAERAATPPAPSVPFASTGPHGHRQRMRERLLALAHDPAVLPGMAKAGRARVMRDFTWAAKAGQVERIWRAVVEGHPLPQELPRRGDIARR